MEARVERLNEVDTKAAVAVEQARMNANVCKQHRAATIADTVKALVNGSYEVTDTALRNPTESNPFDDSKFAHPAAQTLENIELGQATRSISVRMDEVPIGSSEPNKLVASGYTHIAEFAASGRSTCKTCGEKIEQGHLRIGTFKLGKPNEWWPEWRHESCQGLLQIHQTLGADIVKLFIHEDLPLTSRKAISERFATDATCGAASGDAVMGEAGGGGLQHLQSAKAPAPSGSGDGSPSDPPRKKPHVAEEDEGKAKAAPSRRPPRPHVVRSDSDSDDESDSDSLPLASIQSNRALTADEVRTRAKRAEPRVQGGPCTGSRADVLRRRPAARSPPAALHHVDTCCCCCSLWAFELQRPCPPPCRALHGPC